MYKEGKEVAYFGSERAEIRIFLYIFKILEDGYSVEKNVVDLCNLCKKRG